MGFGDDSILDIIDKVSTSVINRYYRDYPEDVHQEMYQECHVKILEIFKAGKYNPTCSLYNYLFTICRNTMSNYLYHKNKRNIEISFDVSYTEVEGEGDDFYNTIAAPSHTNYELPMDVVDSIVSKYKRFGNYKSYALKHFKELGIYEGNIEVEEVKDFNPLVCSAVIGEILWEILVY